MAQRVRREEQWVEPLHNYRNEVRDYYLTHIGCTRQECADALGISRTTVYRHLKALRAMQSERKDAA